MSVIHRIVIGQENEYSVSVPGASASTHERVLHGLMRQARTLVHLPGADTGIYAANGGRVLIDRTKFEYSTPECSGPIELVTAVKAGERLVARFASEHQHDTACNAPQQLMVFGGTTDYAGVTTCGCHENYSCNNAAAEEFYAQMLSFLASRVCVCGGGGFDPTSPGARFVLSPRAYFLDGATAETSTRERPLYHLKEESLGLKEYQRVHLICGDALAAETSLYLRAATTAMVVAALDSGGRIDPRLRLRDPCGALRTFSADTSLRARCETDGARMSSLELQRAYLEMVESRLAVLPEWAPAAYSKWRDMLERLDARDDALSRELDWCCKRAVFGSLVERRGFDWDSLNRCTDALEALLKRLGHGQHFAGSAEIEDLLSSDPAEAKACLDEHGCSAELLLACVGLAAELKRLDLMYHQIFPADGIHDQLAAAGCVARIASARSVRTAETSPPAQNGRAAVRAALIRRYAKRDSYSASWTEVTNMLSDVSCDLADPWCDKPGKWRPCDAEKRMEDLSQSLYDAYKKGELRRARQVMRKGARILARSSDQVDCTQSWKRHAAWVRARLGQPAVALRLLDALYGPTRTLHSVADYLQVYRFGYLVPSYDAEDCIDFADAHLATAESAQSVVIREYMAIHYLGRNKSVERALELIRGAFETEQHGLRDKRILARLMSDEGEIERCAGHDNEARIKLEAAIAAMRAGAWQADLCDALMRLGKLERANSLLREAAEIQMRFGDMFGLLRNMLLKARLSLGRGAFSREGPVRVLLERERITSSTADEILCCWQEWITGVQRAGTDYYWGL